MEYNSEIEIVESPESKESAGYVSECLEQFRIAQNAKAKTIEEQKKDFLFYMGKQWEEKDERELKDKGVLAITDNRLKPNVLLLTGLQRQNRTEFRAFPEGAEDSLHADVATALLKNAMKQSNGAYKFSETFKDGLICGESYQEFYLDSTYNFITPTPRWKKCNFDQIFPEPGFSEYDLQDASYVFKFTADLKKGDLITLFPEKEDIIKARASGKLDVEANADKGTHSEGTGYLPPGEGQTQVQNKETYNRFDLLEKYYKRWEKRFFVIDKLTGNIIEAREEEDKTPEEAAKAFVNSVTKNDPQQEGRFSIIKRTVPEIWYMAVTGGINEPLANERAWSYPKSKNYPFVPYFAEFMDIPVDNKKDDSWRWQGIIRNSVSTQKEVNKRKTQAMRYVDSSTNSGWKTPHNAWVDRKLVEDFGTVPGINLEYKPEIGEPQQIFPAPISQANVFAYQDAAESIKAQTGINADLLASQQGGGDSGRAILLRQRQGISIVQEKFDNFSRTMKIAGMLILSQLSEIYDYNAVKRVLGDAFLEKNFSADAVDPVTGQPTKQFDEESFRALVDDIFNDINLSKYDISVGEAVMSESMTYARFSELKEFVQMFPQFIPPDVIIEESSLPTDLKSRILNYMQQAQEQKLKLEQAKAGNPPPPQAPNVPALTV